MGLADRDYQKDIPQGGNSFAQRLTPVVKWLLILNIGIFVADLFLIPKDALGINPTDLPPLTNWGAFTIQSTIFGLRLWELLTFQFLHFSPGHILCNALGLYFFGPWLERWWGSGKFLAYYLLCGAAGALFFTLLFFVGILHEAGYLIGASAGIYGILVGVAFVAPDLRVMLVFPPIEMSMKQLAIVVLVIAAGSVMFRLGDNSGGEAGHLGGAILGFILMKFPWLLGGGASMEAIRPKAFQRKYESKLRPRTSHQVHEDDEVDRILDKVSQQGIQSLTQEERETLQNAAKRHS